MNCLSDKIWRFAPVSALSRRLQICLDLCLNLSERPRFERLADRIETPSALRPLDFARFDPRKTGFHFFASAP
jgi:hypothetical protein